MATTGRTDFTAQEVLEDLQVAGTSYAENTIKTMISGQMVYDGFLDRVSRGVFCIAARAAGTAPAPTPAAGRAQLKPAPAPAVSSAWNSTAGQAAPARPAGTCQGCGKEGLIMNTMCRKCRNGGF